MEFFGIYARSATDAALTEKQICACREYVKRIGGQVVAVYQDVPANGGDKSRPAYQAMLEDIAEHNIDAVVAVDMNRFSNDMSTTMYLCRLCQFHDIPLLTLAEGRINELCIRLNAALSGVLAANDAPTSLSIYIKNKEEQR